MAWLCLFCFGLFTGTYHSSQFSLHYNPIFHVLVKIQSAGSLTDSCDFVLSRFRCHPGYVQILVEEGADVRVSVPMARNADNSVRGRNIVLFFLYVVITCLQVPANKYLFGVHFL
jgi:hypothetical protein